MSSKVSSISGMECSDEFLQEAFELYSKYYRNVSPQTFSRDMKKTDQIFYIRGKDGRLAGFTGQNVMELDGEKSGTVFCGAKTVLDKKYWGTPLSGRLQYAWMKKPAMSCLLRSDRDIYLYSAVTGYKTYLLFTKQAFKRWPAYDSNESQLAPLIEQISKKLYPDTYKPESGLIDFGFEYIVTDEDARVNELSAKEDPHIAFFEKMNPGWREAKGLPLLVKLDLQTMAYFLFKKVKKILRIK